MSTWPSAAASIDSSTSLAAAVVATANAAAPIKNLTIDFFTTHLNSRDFLRT
jgi:hypothetical protein